MKRLFTMIAAIFVLCVAWGQQISPKSGVYQFTPKSDVRSVGTRSDSRVWWNNYDAEGDWFFTQTSQTGHYSVATFIPMNLVGGSGTTVEGFSFFPISSSMTNIKVWVSTSLPKNGGEADLETKSVSLTLEEFNDVVFNNEHVIPQNGLYVGYSFDIPSLSDNYANRAVLHTDTEDNRDGALWVYTPEKSKWEKMTGNLIAKVAFGGDALYRNSVSVRDFGMHFAPKNGSVEIPVTLINEGANYISSIDYTITKGNSVSSEIHKSCSLSGYSKRTTNITLDAEATAGETAIKLTITKVNGVANTNSSNAATGSLITLVTSPKTIPVMEEYTGTWCGWCPRGMVALKLINETYGDDVITIAVHSGDGMAIPQYSFHSSLISGYPSATINRGEAIDPYYDRNNLEEALKTIVPAEVKVSAVWADNSKTSIKIKSETTCGYSSSSSSLTVGFVLVADGLKGWSQSNYYAGRSETDPNLKYLTNLPSSITDIEYDHVAVDGWGVQYGLDGSVSSTVVAGVPQKFSYSADISSNKLIQDKSKLHVVALLLDKNTGKIFNAAKTSIAEPGSNTTPVSIGSAKQLTYCSDKDLDFTDLENQGVKAYVATGYDKATGTIWLTRVKEVPANTGFLMTGEQGTYNVPLVDGASNAYYKNMFKGTISGETIYTTDGGYTNYYLSNGDYGVGFYKVGSSVDLKANRAYLPIPTDIPTAGSEGDTEVIKVGSALQVPYYTSKNIDFTTMDAQGVKAYTATGYNYGTGTIWLTRVKKVPAQTGVLIMANAAGEYSVPTATVSSYYANMFVGSESARTIYDTETIGGVNYVNYYLSNGEYGVGFYKAKAEGVSMVANRCYLQVPYRASASGARGESANAAPAWSDMIVSDDVISIPVYGEGSEDITNIQSSIFNSQSEEVYYNLQGQRVDNPGKGIYIRNGVKVVIK